MDYNEVRINTLNSGAMTEGAKNHGTYTLRPYRTFREVKQPESQFILRLKAREGEPPTVALIDATGGGWKNTAALAVADWLAANLSETVHPIIIV